MVTGSYLSINTLNVNGLNTPTKMQRLPEWIQKQDPSILLLTRDPPQNKRHIHTESEGLENIYSMQIETKRKQEWQYSYQIK